MRLLRLPRSVFQISTFGFVAGAEKPCLVGFTDLKILRCSLVCDRETRYLFSCPLNNIKGLIIIFCILTLLVDSGYTSAASEVSSILESRISGTSMAGNVEETGRVLSMFYVLTRAATFVPYIFHLLGVGDGIGRVWGLKNVQGNQTPKKL